jgi:replication factor C subunit 1
LLLLPSFSLAMKEKIANRPPTLGVVKEIPEGAPGCLQGQAFVISGVLDSLDREAAKTLIERYGGRVTGSVSRKTSFLIFGQEAGESKRKQTPIIDEDGLLELIRTRKGQSLGAAAASSAKAASAKAKKAQSSAHSAAQGVTASVDAGTSRGREQLRVHGKTADRAEDMLWVDKHRPLRLADIIGNASCVSRLTGWLKSWNATFRGQAKAEKGSFKAVLITGAPGIGKSTSAALVARSALCSCSSFPPCIALSRSLMLALFACLAVSGVVQRERLPCDRAERV